MQRALERYGSDSALFSFLEKHPAFTADSIRFLRKQNDIVMREFSGVYRESGDPYVTHLWATCVLGAVYVGITDPEKLAAYLQHDTLEQFHGIWTRERLAAESTERVARIVATCSIDRNLSYYHDEDERLDFFFKGIAADREASECKILDRASNQLTLPACAMDKRWRKNAETVRHVVPITGKYSFLEAELQESVAWNHGLLVYSSA